MLNMKRNTYFGSTIRNPLGEMGENAPTFRQAGTVQTTNEISSAGTCEWRCIIIEFQVNNYWVRQNYFAILKGKRIYFSLILLAYCHKFCRNDFPSLFSIPLYNIVIYIIDDYIVLWQFHTHIPHSFFFLQYIYQKMLILQYHSCQYHNF